MVLDPVKALDLQIAPGALQMEVPSLLRQIPALSALGLFALTWVVTPANARRTRPLVRLGEADVSDAKKGWDILGLSKTARYPKCVLNLMIFHAE